MKKETTTIEKPEAKIEEISKDIVTIQTEAQKVVCKTEDDVLSATEFITKVKAQIDRVNEWQTFFTEPYVEQRRVALAKKQEIEALFGKQLAPLTDTMNKIKRAIADYRLDQEKKARAEEDRLLKIREKANEKREAEGKEQILAPVKTVERAAPTVMADSGRATTKKVWKFEVVETKMLVKDRAFMTELFILAVQKGLHEQVLRNMVKNGVRQVEGTRIYEDFEVSVTAK